MAKKSTLQDRIDEIQKYFRSIELKENLYIVRVMYPDKWEAFPSENGVINVTRVESMNNEWYYYAHVDETDLDNIFNLIKETIENNKSAEEKALLYREKMYELKEIFSDEVNTIEMLRSIKFVFDQGRPKKKKTAKQKKIEEEIAEYNSNQEKTEETNGD